METNAVDLFVPITMFIVLGAMWIAFFYFRYKSRLRAHDTIQVALEKGAELTPELIDQMITPPFDPDRDLRKGIIGISIGIAFILFAFILDDQDAVRPLIATGVFPFIVGIAYLIIWKIPTNRKNSE